MGNIAQNQQRLAGKVSVPGFPQGIAVQQACGWMGMRAIVGVDNAAAQTPFGQKLSRAAALVADAFNIGMHGLKGQARVLEWFRPC